MCQIFSIDSYHLQHEGRRYYGLLVFFAYLFANFELKYFKKRVSLEEQLFELEPVKILCVST